MTTSQDRKTESSFANSRKQVTMFSPFMSEKAIARVVKILQSGYIGTGPVVKEFEEKFCKVVKVPYAVAVNSCTSALHLALTILDVAAGDEIITTPQTFMAPSHVILAQGARPVYTDVQYLTGNMDPNDIEHRITEHTKAIMPVHWGGYPCDLDEIEDIAARYGLPVIEDAAHAVGASYKGRSVGSISTFTCFSFGAIKQITTGDGGMLCMTDGSLHSSAQRCRWFGIDRMKREPSILGEPKFNVTELGYKYQMNDICASLGVENLTYLPNILLQRAEIVRHYREELQNVEGVTLFESCNDRVSANWLFCMHVEERTEFARMMNSKGVGVSVVHLRIDRNDLFGPIREDLTTLADLTETIIALPIHNNLSVEDVEYVIQCVKGGW